MELTLKKGGKLTRTDWVYDEEKDHGSYVTKDINDPSFLYLNEICKLDDDITLKDVFLLLEKDMDFYKILLRNWIDEIVHEGLYGESNEDKSDGMEFLELYWYMERETDEGKSSLLGYHFPEFHGWGTWPEDLGGQKGGFSVAMSSPANLRDYPLKLKDEIKIGHCNLDDFRLIEPTMTIDKASYTLYNILYGIVWELSWHGSPTDRNKKAKDLGEIVDKIKKGEAKTVP